MGELTSSLETNLAVQELRKRGHLLDHEAWSQLRQLSDEGRDRLWSAGVIAIEFLPAKLAQDLFGKLRIVILFGQDLEEFSHML